MNRCGRRAASSSVVGSCPTVLAYSARRPQGRRPCVSDRVCLTGIVFVLRSGIPWQMLPQELGCWSGIARWRCLRDWQQAGVWDPIHFALPDWLAREDQIDRSRAVVDSCCIRAVYGDGAWRSVRRSKVMPPAGRRRKRSQPTLQAVSAKAHEAQSLVAMTGAPPWMSRRPMTRWS